MKEDIVDKILSSTGYLPPRNEEEMEALEKVFSDVEIDKSQHVDVESIVNGTCRYTPVIGQRETVSMSSKDLSLAARNFEHMPKDVIDKIKKQHTKKDDGDK